MPLIQKNIKSNYKRSEMDSLYPNHDTMNFEELENKSKILGLILKESGCDQGDPICCLMEKSPYFWITIRGIEYAGCVSVPLNPEEPVYRIHSAIFETGAQWVIADKNAKHVLNNGMCGRQWVNIGWMDTTKDLPSNCYPEFVRDNINDIGLRPVLPEPDNSTPIISFNSLKKEENSSSLFGSFNQSQLENFIVPILEFAGLDSQSRVIGMMSPGLASFLLEYSSMFLIEAQLFMGQTVQKFYSEELYKEIQRQNITHLLLESQDIEKFIRTPMGENMVFPTIKSTVIWGEISSKSKIYKLNNIFPNADIYKITRGTARRLWVHEYMHLEQKFIPGMSIPGIIRNQHITKGIK